MPHAPTRLAAMPAAALLAVVLAGCSVPGPTDPSGPPVSSGAFAASDDAGTGTAAGSPGRASASATAGASAPAARPRVAVPRVAGTVATGLAVPWGLAFLPDGSALVALRDSGYVVRVVPAAAGRAGSTTRVGRVAGVVHVNEGGLLGLAVPPGPSPSYVLAYTTTARDNRVVRLAWDGRRLGRQTTVLAGIPRAGNHDGGRLRIGPDGLLYVSTGDATDRERAQDRTSLAGKILRVTLAGRPAPGNPFPGSPVYSYGHRNVQGLAFDSAGRLWATEFGDRTTDELNLIRAGGNYGWPRFEGPARRSGYVDPVAWWSPTSTASPSGLAVAGGSAWVASLRGRVLWQVPLSGARASAPVARLRTLGRLRTVETAPDGSLWVVTNNTDGRGSPRTGDDRIVRLVLR